MAKIVATSTVDVEVGQYLPFPATNTYVLAGPGKARVDRYDSGHLEVTVLEGQTKPMTLAIAKKWNRLGWEV